MPTVEAQGSVLIVRDGQRFTALARRPSTKRGSITRFTVSSRRRLIESVARLHTAKIRTSFLTLTFAGMPTAEQAKAAFKRLRSRFDRRFAKWSAYWRMEHQERGAIHFHLLCFNLPYIPQAVLQRTWQQCTGEPMSIVNISLVEGGSKAAKNYVSKYVAKLPPAEIPTSLDKAPYLHGTGEDDPDPGRFWGIINRNRLPYAPRRKIWFGDMVALLKLWSWMQAATHGKVGMERHNARCYCDNPYQLIQRLSVVASCLTGDVTHADGSKIKMVDQA